MQAFLAILRYDIGQLTHSWLLRIWVALLVAPALFLVVVAANESELASETLAAYLAAIYAPLSAVAISIIAVGAVSGEAGVVADSILSKSVTRTEYLSAKIVSRVGITVGIYLAVLVPFTYLVVRYAVRDTSTGGVILGLAMVGLLLTFLAALGIALSTVFRNVLMAALILLVGIVLSGGVFQFMGVTWMSATAVINELPTTFRGDTPLWDEARVLFMFFFLTTTAIIIALSVFRRRDL